MPLGINPERAKRVEGLIFFILPLLFVLGLNIYFRTFTINFPQIKKKAAGVVDEVTRQVIAQDVYRKFPQFNPLAKDKLIKNKVAEYKKQNRKHLDGQIQEGYLKLKDKYQDENGHTYLMELDCWHWARYVDNVLRHGRPGDEVYGKQWDSFMLAPVGMYLLWDQFLFYFSAVLYKFFSLFKQVPLFTFLFYLPLLFAALFVVSLYGFTFRYAGYLGAAITCLFVGLGPIFLPRSCSGWFDKDILNMLFPLLAMWAYILAYRQGSFKRRLLCICLSSFWVGIFCFDWAYWWFILAIISMYEALSLAYLFFRSFYFKDKVSGLLKEHSISLSLFLLFSFLWVIILSGFEPVEVLYKQLKLALVLNKPLMASIWPNVFSTVGELRTMNLGEIAGSVGGNFIFIFSLISMLILLVRVLCDKNYADFKRQTFMILFLWLISMFFASTRGIRFAVFLLIPLGIFSGWAINDAYEYFKAKVKIWPAIFIFLIFVFLSIGFINRARRTAENIYPLMDDGWYKVLSLVKEKTPPETILNSWWDFGDWFKVVANRRVIFDGQTQDNPRAYWMGRALLSDNEEKAIGILRMLNNGGNKAFEIIDNYLKDPAQSVLLLESVVSYEPEKAQKVLLNFLPASVAEEVMKLLFKRPPRACFIVDNTMPFKMPAISYLGNWDFSKVYIAQNFNKREKDQILEHLKKLGQDNQQMQQFYQEAFLITAKNLDDWLSHRVQFYSGLVNGREKDGIVFFENDFIYNPKEQTIRSNSGGHIPRNLFVLTGNDFQKITYSKADLAFSAMVFKKDDTYKCALLDGELATSLFSRLYFFNGKGLKHFLPFVEAEEGNNYIRVFDIAW